MWYDGEYKCINAGRELRGLGKPEEGLRWFWDPMEASGLHHLIYTGYSIVTHAMVRALCERWHMAWVEQTTYDTTGQTLRQLHRVYYY